MHISECVKTPQPQQQSFSRSVQGAISVCRSAGTQFNIKMMFQYFRKSHCRDKMILWQSYLHNEIYYAGNKTVQHWIGLQNIILLRWHFNTVETLYNTINFCWNTHKRHSIARPKGSSKGNILCRLINIELYKIFAIINRAIKGLHCICMKSCCRSKKIIIHTQNWHLISCPRGQVMECLVWIIAMTILSQQWDFLYW